MESSEPCCSKNSGQEERKRSQIELTDLPFEVLQKIIGTFSFTEIAKIRLVSKKISNVCAELLNTEFSRLRTTVSNRLEYLKSQLPKRASLRKEHPFFKESELLEAINVRLNVVDIKLSKHLEKKEICFFAGEILDEVNLLIRGEKSNHPRPTEEFVDLCIMATDYFAETIKPLLPKQTSLEFWNPSKSVLGADFKDNVGFKKTPALRDCTHHHEEDGYIFKETDQASMQAFQKELTEPDLKQLKISLKKVTSQIKKNSNAIKILKLSLKYLDKNVMKLRKMVFNLKQQLNKGHDAEQEKNMKECLTKLNECNEIIDSVESQLSNCGESEEALMQSTSGTAAENENKNNAIEQLSSNLQNEKICNQNNETESTNLNQYYEKIDSVESQLSNSEKSEEALMQSTSITAAENENKNNAIEQFSTNLQNEKIGSENQCCDSPYCIVRQLALMQSTSITSAENEKKNEVISSENQYGISSPSLASISQPVIPNYHRSLKRKFKVSSTNILPKKKKMKSD